MKKIIYLIATAVVCLAMVSCGGAENKQEKAYQREMNSVLSDMSPKAKEGWKYLESNLNDNEEYWVIQYQELDERDCKDPRNPLSKFGLDGLSIGLYTITDIDDDSEVLMVYFKNGKPRMVSDKQTFLDFPKLAILLIDAWDERSDYEKERVKAGRNASEWQRQHQTIMELRKGL